MKNVLTIALSNRHCHLTKEDIEILFGKGYQLTPIRDLTQPGQYVSDETIDIKSPKATINKVRILGPARKNSQIEILVGDCYKLGLPIVIRNSGKVANTPGITIIGPKGMRELSEGVIVAARHIHMNLKEAEEFGVKDMDIVDVQIDGPRALIFKNVLIRAGDNNALDMHVDIEEGNAAGIRSGQKVKIIKIY